MKITAIETIQIEEYASVLWVHVHTDEGIIGLGETMFGADAVAAYIHETAAPLLLGQDPLRIDFHSRRLLSGYVGFAGTGAEMRGASAIDIALWDIFGQASGQPVHQLLGGLSREHIRVYNTCAGYQYTTKGRGQVIMSWGLMEDQAPGPYEDLQAFLHRADELAESLLEMGISGMKIWPFDPAAEASGGMNISQPDLEKALEPFRKIRATVGDKMDIMAEFHSLWNLPTAKRIFDALDEINCFWYEDPIKMNNLDALAELAGYTRVPICASETLATRFAFRELMARQAAGIIMLDISWCGGLSEAKKIATMAEAHHLPVAPHDCTGPVVLAVSTALSLNAPNALIQEVVRAFYCGWYRDVVTEVNRVENGYIYPLTGPGLGLKLQPDLLERQDVTIRRSEWHD